ncbi:hypothetical protein GCM10009841_21720 [Microlunatus panaciterrae]|uniref:Uncharacterized protein n=1 Tax=Microlunatus panaciterrae TaxID=400768 RepID=A0ABS2RNY8_9ACTN|nr:hypothetical protein [Microlunatus panaciterrae]MBM7800726.1 hypothetical protein [Microlunatus panaciterrae]
MSPFRGSPTLLLIRPADHVILSVNWTGLRLETSTSGEAPFLVAADAGATLLVTFPPQHLAEETLAESGTPTLSAPVAGPGSDVPVCRALLSGPSRLSVRLPAGTVVRASVAGFLDALAAGSVQPSPSPPTDADTAVEVPWRMVWAPGSAVPSGRVRVVPASRPDSATSGASLWQARLIDAGDAAPTAPLLTAPLLTCIDPTMAGSPDPPFRIPLGRLDRVSLAREAARIPARAERIELTAVGASLQATGLWPGFEWEQSVALGRDMRVRTLARGAMFPFGHRAEFLELTMRSFDPAMAQAAALRTRLVLVVTEPVRTPTADLSFPFGAVTVVSTVVDNLDPVPGTGRVSFFRPMRGGVPVLFDVELANPSQPASAALPMIFVANVSESTSLGDERLIDPGLIRQVSAAYGQVRVALKSPAALDLVGASTPAPGDVHEVHALTLGGARDADQFVPQLSGLQVGLPAVRTLLDDTATREVKFAERYLRGGDGHDALLELVDSTIKINFVGRTERSGGLVAPQYVANALSRTVGPVSLQALPDPVSGLIQPGNLFGPDASLLGFKLRDLLGPLPNKSPRITSSLRAGQIPEVSMTWTDVKFDPRPPLPMFIANPQTRLSELTVTSSGDSTTTLCVINNFDLLMPPVGPQVLRLHFGSITFEQHNGQTPAVNVRGVEARFLGVLQLLEELQHFVDLGAAGPYLDLSRTGVTARYSLPLPPVAAGAFVLRNIVFRAAITVPFNGDPVTLELAFASRREPFVLTVLAFGGGGYVELAMDHTGLTRLEAALEFGAVIALDFVVASAEVHALGGIRFAIQPGGSVSLTGYLRIGGSVDILGLVSVSVELRIELSYQAESKALVGRATLVVEIDLTLWSDSVELDSGEWVLAGGASPLEEAIPFAALGGATEHDRDLQRWKDYRAAFAHHDTDST